MPVLWLGHPSSEEPVIILNNIEFVRGEEPRHFRLSDSKGHEIRIEYFPKSDSIWTPDRFEIFLFENPYLNAENDVFELFLNTLDTRLGWLFPLATLESNDNNYVDYKSFKHIRWVAYHKLLGLEIKLDYQEGRQEYRLSDFFPGLIVCILSKDDIAKVPNFNITDYVLSFLKKDYLIFNGSHKGIPVFDKRQEIQALREGNHIIKLRKSNFNIKKNAFIKSLFIEHLYQSENFLVRYILLYQILEHFIEEQGDVILDNLIATHKRGEISKNDLREQISKSSSDRNLLKKVFQQSTIDGKLRDNFYDNCKFLFTDIKKESKENFEDVLYDLRNLITHNYRVVVDKTDELKEIIKLFELIMIELLINYKVIIEIDEPPANVTAGTIAQKSNSYILPGGDDEMGYTGLSSWLTIIQPTGY
jgi:hypothetical protein